MAEHDSNSAALPLCAGAGRSADSEGKPIVLAQALIPRPDGTWPPPVVQ